MKKWLGYFASAQLALWQEGTYILPRWTKAAEDEKALRDGTKNDNVTRPTPDCVKKQQFAEESV